MKVRERKGKIDTLKYKTDLRGLYSAFLAVEAILSRSRRVFVESVATTF
tara:strand:- start:128 stop:274 length:147 start_codon:yes stop_codon:yes gene_type:complete